MDLADWHDGTPVRDWERPFDGEPVRLAIVGLGGFAREHALPAIEESDRCVATVVVSGSPAVASRVADEHDIEHTLTYEDYRDGLAVDGYDAVYVVTPNARHLEYCTIAADRGKHVMCEKPLEVTTERAQRLVTACTEAGVVSMTAYRMQLAPELRRIREFIRNGFVGDPVHVQATFSFHMRAEEDDKPWRIQPDLSGGGALMDVGVYLTNTTRFLLDADPVSLQATAVSRREAFRDVDESAAFTLTFPDNTLASCTSSFQGALGNRVRVVGTEGAVTIDPAFAITTERAVTLERGGGETVLTPPVVNEVREQFEHFANCVQTGSDPEPDGSDGLTDVSVLEAVYRSAESGVSVDL